MLFDLPGNISKILSGVTTYHLSINPWWSPDVPRIKPKLRIPDYDGPARPGPVTFSDLIFLPSPTLLQPFLEKAMLIYTSGPSHLLPPLPGTLFLQIFTRQLLLTLPPLTAPAKQPPRFPIPPSCPMLSTALIT